MKKVIWSALFASMALFSISCSEEEEEEKVNFSEEQKQEFIDDECEDLEGEDLEACECFVDKMTNEFTYERFLELDEVVSSDDDVELSEQDSIDIYKAFGFGEECGFDEVVEEDEGFSDEEFEAAIEVECEDLEGEDLEACECFVSSLSENFSYDRYVQLSEIEETVDLSVQDSTDLEIVIALLSDCDFLDEDSENEEEEITTDSTENQEVDEKNREVIDSEFVVKEKETDGETVKEENNKVIEELTDEKVVELINKEVLVKEVDKVENQEEVNKEVDQLIEEKVIEQIMIDEFFNEMENQETDAVEVREKG